MAIGVRSDAAQPAQPPPPRLRRTLRLWEVSLSGLGVILGAGVYALIGPAALKAGNALWATFFVAGITAGLTAYTYIRLAPLRPKNAPEYQYTSLAFGPAVGFVAGWLMLAASILAGAAVALGFAGYLRHLVGTAITLNLALLFVVVTAVMFLGIAESVRIALILTAVEGLGLVCVIVVGAPHWAKTNFVDTPLGLGGLFAGAALVFFSYLGFEQLGNFAEEMERPDRDLPRALGIAMAGSMAVYVLTALSAVAVVDWRRLGASDAPLALVVGTILGTRADSALTLMALAATANTVLLVLLSASRSLYGLASAGVMPGWLARITRGGTPLSATLLVPSLAATIALAGDLSQVAKVTDAAILVSFALVNVSLPVIAHRARANDGRRFGLGDRVIPILALLLSGLLLIHTGWRACVVVVVLAGAGVAVYIATKSLARPVDR